MFPPTTWSPPLPPAPLPLHTHVRTKCFLPAGLRKELEDSQAANLELGNRLVTATEEIARVVAEGAVKEREAAEAALLLETQLKSALAELAILQGENKRLATLVADMTNKGQSDEQKVARLEAEVSHGGGWRCVCVCGGGGVCGGGAAEAQ